jgi:hypothetical protein
MSSNHFIHKSTAFKQYTVESDIAFGFEFINIKNVNTKIFGVSLQADNGAQFFLIVNLFD